MRGRAYHSPRKGYGDRLEYAVSFFVLRDPSVSVKLDKKDCVIAKDGFRDGGGGDGECGVPLPACELVQARLAEKFERMHVTGACLRPVPRTRGE